MKKKIVSLAEKFENIYQDIELDGEKIARGKRACRKRWDMIKPHLKNHDVIMDIGSALGYFTHKIAKELPDSLTVSFEADPKACEIQKKIYEHEGIYNLVLCQHKLKKSDLDKWINCVEMFDVILALSVLHHYPKNLVRSVLKNLCKLTPLLIGEVPHPSEEGAPGKASAEIVRKLIRHKVKWIGSTSSPHSSSTRGIWIKSCNPSRRELDGYFGVSHKNRNKYNLRHKDGEWLLNNKSIIHGVNVWNLLHFNVIWPPPSWWKTQARAAYDALIEKSDVRPWNLIFTSTGLKAIDYANYFPRGEHGKYKLSDLKKLDKIFDQMKPIKWDKL